MERESTVVVPPNPVLLRVLGAAATAAAVVLLAFVIAFWGWRWFGPVPQPVAIDASTTPAQWAQRINSAHLFGRDDSASKSVQAAVAPSDARLLGIFAEPQGKGYALFRLPSGPRLVSVGQALPDGSVLESVRPDAIVLTQGGTRRDLSLHPGTTAAVATPVRVTGTAGTIANASGPAKCSPPTGFTGQTVRLNAELLGGMTSTPGTWKAMLQSSNGALVVRDQSGFAGMLGLRDGDRIDQANGVVLRLPEDVADNIVRPLTRSLPVTLVGHRDGQVKQWLYLNAGACPT